MELKKRYEAIVKEYIKLFCKKQGLELQYWTADNIGGLADFGDYYFNFDDIRYDIDNNCPKGLIIKWQDDGVEHNMNRKVPQYINYYSYNLGLRYKDLNKKKRHSKKEKEDLKKLQEKIEETKEILLNEIKEFIK